MINVEEAEKTFRQTAIRVGLLTPQQAQAVHFRRLNRQQADAEQAATGVPQCQCEACLRSQSLFSVSIDDNTLSELQIDGLLMLFKNEFGVQTTRSTTQ
jgi:hypothetical protein